MAKVWTNGCDYFEDEEAAREDSYENIGWDDIEEYFQNNVDFHAFFTRVREKIGAEFFDMFTDEWCEAENEFFNDNYWEEEKEEEE